MFGFCSYNFANETAIASARTRNLSEMTGHVYCRQKIRKYITVVLYQSLPMNLRLVGSHRPVVAKFGAELQNPGAVTGYEQNEPEI